MAKLTPFGRPARPSGHAAAVAGSKALLHGVLGRPPSPAALVQSILVASRQLPRPLSPPTQPQSPLRTSLLWFSPSLSASVRKPLRQG